MFFYLSVHEQLENSDDDVKKLTKQNNELSEKMNFHTNSSQQLQIELVKTQDEIRKIKDSVSCLFHCQ